MRTGGGAAQAAHLAAVRARSHKADLGELSAKAAVALLRYVDGIVPADRAFFEAGIACRAAGWTNMAFVFLNRYLDVTEAMDDGARWSDALEAGEYADTDIPQRFPLPPKHFVQEATREEAAPFPPHPPLLRLSAPAPSLTLG